MSYEDFAGFWKVKKPGSGACKENSIVTFYRHPMTKKVTVFCAEIPYKEGTGCYKPPPDNTIEVMIGEEIYVIKMQSTASGPPEIAFGPKGSGPLAGSWTAEDYVPGSAPKSAGE